MLAAFPELMKDYEAFKMKPHIGGGYGERYDKRTVTGYWSWRKSGKMGTEGDLNVPNHQATFWAQDDFLTGETLIGQNDFVEVKGDVFRVIEDDDFSHEGGFTKCLMQRLAALDGRQVTNIKVDEAVRSDY
jgi:hypothetical protein